MKRTVITIATLLASALGAQAASPKLPPTASMPPGFRAVFNDTMNAIQRGSANPRAHDSACLSRQAQLANDIEALVGQSDMVRRNPAMIELRTRCMPVHVCINCPPEY